MEQIKSLRAQIDAKPTLFQKLGLEPKPVDPTPLINPLLEKIAEKHFSAFIGVYARETSASEDDVRALKQDCLDALIQNVCLLAEMPDQAQFALAMKMDATLQGMELKRYVAGAEKIFLEFPDETEPERKPTPIRDFTAIRLIALAIQETVLSIPLRFYEGPETVSDEVEASLYKILSDVEKIRKAYELAGVLELAKSTSQLYRKIALADEYVWLPLKPLITAPLARQELLLYARESAESNHLANQIIKSDGVILITGYRGVGKSTFINQVLHTVEQAQELQMDEVTCKIIAIPMSVAKVASVGGALRLCIRAIYKTFRDLENQEEQPLTEKSHGLFKKPSQLLTDPEKQHLWFANLRASYRVNMSQAEARSQSRLLQGELGINPGDFFPGPVKAALMTVVPTVGYKMSKEWNEKMDRTISLLDYDEDRAEEDIARFIDMLATPRPYQNKQVRVKLVFIFDEMDKMEAKEGQDALIRSLKNLFLTRHAVFLLVTSKEFYYMLLEDRKKEDSILGSYFSSVVTVPMFTAANTQKLLEKLLADTSGLSSNEQSLIYNLARYFTYRAHGLPREVMREICLMQQWSTRLLQPYLTDRSILPGAIQLYALIQDVIENLNSRTETDSSEKDLLFVRERIWLNEGRQEQVRRGLYILVEELLNQGSFTVDLNTRFSAYDSNFSTVAYADFCNIFDQLARKLALIRLPDDLDTGFFERVVSDPSAEPTSNPTSRRASSKDGKKSRVASQPEASQPSVGKQIAIRVLPSFYALTGRQIVQSERTDMDEAALALRPEEVMQQVNDLLEQDSLFLTRRALNFLAQYPSLPIPDDIQDKLFHLFISSRDLAFRLDAVKYLSSEGFYRNVGDNYPETMLKDETNESILHCFLDLIGNGATHKANRESAYRMLRELLDRNLTRRNPLPLPVFEEALLEIEKLIARDGKEAEELLRQILETPALFQSTSGSLPTGMEAPPNEFIPQNFVPALVSLAAKAKTNLPMALLDHDTEAALDQETLNAVVGSLSMPETIKLWEYAIVTRGRGSPKSESTLAAALLKLASLLPERSEILHRWLHGPEWSELDNEVLITAGKINPKLFYKLEKNFGKDRAGLAYERLQSIHEVSVPEESKRFVKSAGQANTPYKNLGWLNLLLGGAMLALFLYVDLDLAPALSPWDRLSGRAVQFAGAMLGFLAIGLAAFGILEWDKRSNRKWYVLGVLASLGLSAFMYWALDFAGFPITLPGELLLAAILLGVVAVPALAQYLLLRRSRRAREKQP